MESNIKISRIHNQQRSQLYQDIEPLQENLLEHESPIRYNCGINTESNGGSEIEQTVEILRSERLVEHEIIIDQESQIEKIDRNIKIYKKSEIKAESLYNRITCARTLINVVGNSVSVGCCLVESYSIAIQNMKSFPSLNVIELGGSLSVISLGFIVTKVVKKILTHQQEKLKKESHTYHQEIIKLEAKKLNLIYMIAD